MAVETKKLRWLIAIRLVVITSVAVVHVLRALSPERGIGYEPFLYAITGATYALCLVYLVLMRWLRARPAIQVAVQLIGDISIVTVLVYYFGGAASSCSRSEAVRRKIPDTGWTARKHRSFYYGAKLFRRRTTSSD